MTNRGLVSWNCPDGHPGWFGDDGQVHPVAVWAMECAVAKEPFAIGGDALLELHRVGAIVHGWSRPHVHVGRA